MLTCGTSAGHMHVFCNIWRLTKCFLFSFVPYFQSFCRTLIPLFLIQIFENRKQIKKLWHFLFKKVKAENQIRKHFLKSNSAYYSFLNLVLDTYICPVFFLYLNYLSGHMQSLDKNCLGPLRKAYCSSLNLLLRREVCCTSCWFFFVSLLWCIPLFFVMKWSKEHHYKCEKKY